jgi:hypothetical protein
MIKIIKCGSKVTINLSAIEGYITAISIRFNAISYEVSYFNNGEYKQVWLHDTEFEILNKSNKQSIGFKP